MDCPNVKRPFADSKSELRTAMPSIRDLEKDGSDTNGVLTFAESTEGPPEPPRRPDPKGAKPMPKPHRVWVDAENRLVLVDGYVSLREGMLEMFACPAGTKEHESIVAVLTSAQVVHAALLAVGAEEGQPVRFHPEFQPPAGTEIEIEVRWLDEKQK